MRSYMFSGTTFCTGYICFCRLCLFNYTVLFETFYVLFPPIFDDFCIFPVHFLFVPLWTKGKVETAAAEGISDPSNDKKQSLLACFKRVVTLHSRKRVRKTVTKTVYNKAGR